MNNEYKSENRICTERYEAGGSPARKKDRPPQWLDRFLHAQCRSFHRFHAGMLQTGTALTEDHQKSGVRFIGFRFSLPFTASSAGQRHLFGNLLVLRAVSVGLYMSRIVKQFNPRVHILPLPNREFQNSDGSKIIRQHRGHIGERQ